MKFFLILLICLPGWAVEDDVARVSRLIKQRKEELKFFKEKILKENKCRERDYDCFSREVLSTVKGNTEDLIEAASILEPFYERSIKEGFPPCSDTCQNTMLAASTKLYLDYFLKYDVQDKDSSRIATYPTVSGVKVRALLDLSAHHNLHKTLIRLNGNVARIDWGKVIKPELANKKLFMDLLAKVETAKIFNTSVLCHIKEKDPVYTELDASSTKTGKSTDETYKLWFAEFREVTQPYCADQTPIIYRGTDKATRNYYRQIRDKNLADMTCSLGDFPCVRKTFRKMEIHYAEDVEVVAKRLIAFTRESRERPCDDACKAQSLVRMLQTWITFLSTYEREKLASTMDWNEYPEARYLTITEDIDMYTTLKNILTPIISAYGKIDPQNIRDAGLRSELRSVSRDLSDFASGKMLKDSVICTMEPWVAAYDKYLSPYKDKEKNKKFEAAFLDFKSNVCK